MNQEMESSPGAFPNGRGSVVVVSTDPERTRTVTGLPLLVRWLRRTLGFAAVMTAVVGVALAPTTPSSRWPAILLVGFAGWSLSGIAWLLLIVGDWQAKKSLAEAYGFKPVFGLDTEQHRSVQVKDPPSDLRSAVELTIRSLDDKASIEALPGSKVVATLPRRAGRRWLRCRMEVDWRISGSAPATLEVITKLDEPLGFSDGGRSIVVAEEFVLRLQHVLEKGTPPPPYVWPSRESA